MTGQGQIQDFLWEEAPTLQRGHQHTNLSDFLKNCMKLRKFWAEVGGARRERLLPPLDPPLQKNRVKQRGSLLEHTLYVASPLVIRSNYACISTQLCHY